MLHLNHKSSFYNPKTSFLYLLQKLTIIKFVFVIITFVCWSTSSRANVYFAIENYINDQSLQSLCNDDAALNFSNAVISEINENFISSPVITCLNFMDNTIGKIGKGAFKKLPNLTQLFFSNNRLDNGNQLILNFGSHDQLQVLVMNNVNRFNYYGSFIQIFGEYPNLEILSLRENYAVDLEFAQETSFREYSFTYTTPMTPSQNWMPFPKLKILDFSENSITRTNFVQLLSNSLYFLDLHDNSLSELNLNEKGNKLFTLNLDKNKFNNIHQYNDGYNNGLSMADLKNLHYLSVSGNEINTIESDAFQNNNELLFLNLSSNRIRHLHPKTFANLQYLKTLDLSNNQLKVLQISINETEISTLYISNNDIKNITSDTFMHMPKLIKLLMGKNKIDKIDVNTFVHLTTLEELDLSSNMLSSLPEGWTESLVSLKYLDLCNNEFTSLESLSLTNTLPLITNSNFTKYTEIRKLTIAKIAFTTTFFCWSTLCTTAHDVYFTTENYMDESLQPLCNDNISLNFSNAVISEIKRDFISSPVITCLNFTGNSIEKIGRGAFDRLPNLTQLFLSNNKLSSVRELLNFGGHDKLQVLIMNDANRDYSQCYHTDNIQIFGKYPNLEILSLSNNCFNDLAFVQENPYMESHFTYMTSQNWMPFPKLKILDLSENIIATTNFVQLLSNSLYFLDLHGNLLNKLNLNEKGNKLFALNLDKNKNEIDTIESDAFQNNNELLFLNLSSNRIRHLHPKTFANLQYLETLDLSINQLENVPHISNETEISILYVNNNNINKIIPYTFMHMPKLMKLFMGKNQIDEIDVNAFAHLTVLKELDLSSNMLSSLPEGWTESLVSLKYLNLSDNKFTSLESLSLTNTLPLITVYLMKNSIEYFNVKYFENLPQNLTIHLINSNFTKYIRLIIAKFVFTIIIFVCWSILSIANVDHFAIENYVNFKSLQPLCNDDISLKNFSNVVFPEIKRDFISSPVITCLNLTGNSIEKIDRGAFDRLPNLTQLFLSNNKWSNPCELLNFGGHDKLQMLIINGNAKNCNIDNYYRSSLQIFDDYSNLEILSLRENCIKDFMLDYSIMDSHFAHMTSSSIKSWVPFPKLKILDLSGNRISSNDRIVRLLSNSLYFLDLHDNLLNYLHLNEKGKKLFALNLDRNNFSTINSQHEFQTLSMACLKDLHYLSISKNKINTIESDAFKDNNKLLFLNLSSNYIYELHPKTFANLQNLKTLDLSGNLFENVPQISNETKISTLYLNNNYIYKIISHTFTHMPKLVKLLMRENRIYEIDVNAFAPLTVLEELDLSRNMLSSLPKGLAETFVSLKYLDLRENKFTSLESLSLTNTWPSIKVLYLMKNPLKCLNVKYFKNLSQNLTINLINNSNFTTYVNGMNICACLCLYIYIYIYQGWSYFLKICVTVTVIAVTRRYMLPNLKSNALPLLKSNDKKSLFFVTFFCNYTG
ncbi:ALS protein, partial [Acromyrmex charruanus]